MLPPRHAPTGLLATTVPGHVGYSTPRLRSATTPTTSTIIQRTRQHSLRKWVITFRASTAPASVLWGRRRAEHPARRLPWRHTLATRRRQGGSTLLLPCQEGRPDQALRGPYLASTVQSIRWPSSRMIPTAPAQASLERGHHLAGKAREVFPHHLARRAQGAGDHDVLETGVASLDFLQVADELLGGTAEPGAVLHPILDRRGGRRLGAALGHRLHVLLAVAEHPERAHELGVLLEEGFHSLDRELLRVVDAHAEAEDQVFAELQVAPVASGDSLVVGEPALDELLGGGGNDALDAVLHHEVEPAGAAAHDRLPDLDRQMARPGHHRDLLHRVAPVRHRRRDRVVLALVRERLLVERLEDDLELLLEKLAVRLGVEHGVAEALDLARVIAATHAEDQPAVGQDVRGRVVLGQPNRMPGRDDVEAAADLDPLGVVGDVHGQERNVGDALVAFVLEVVLGEPYGLVPERVHRLRELEGRVERLDHPLVRVAPVVGRRPLVTAVLQLDVSDVEGREALDHAGFSAGTRVRRSTCGSARRAGSTGTRARMSGNARRRSRP